MCPNLKQIDQIWIELTIAFVPCGTIVSLLGFEGGNFDRKSFTIIREIKWDKTIVNDSSWHYSTILVLFLEFVPVDRAEICHMKRPQNSSGKVFLSRSFLTFKRSHSDCSMIGIRGEI